MVDPTRRRAMGGLINTLALATRTAKRGMMLRIPWLTGSQSERPRDTNFIAVANPDQLRALFATHESVVLFIHDQFCGISRAAFREMSEIGRDVHLIVTGDGQHLSALVERYTGIRHESPQVVVLEGRKPKWSASHYAIRREDVLRAIDTLAPGSRE